jgi:hypothetical protein
MVSNRALKLSVGSAVYLGRNVAVTNHHIVSTTLEAAVAIGHRLPADDEFTELSGSRSDQGALRSKFYCLRKEPRGTFVDVSAVASSSLCLPVDRTQTLDPAFWSPPYPVAVQELLFTTVSLDLAVIRLDQAGLERAPAEHSQGGQWLRYARSQPNQGAPVWVAGFPRGRWDLVACVVTDGTAVGVTDPDERIPPELRWNVPSIALECPPDRIVDGASGSGVYDANTGALIGLIWTSTPDARIAFVSPVGAWLEPLRGAGSLADTPIDEWMSRAGR